MLSWKFHSRFFFFCYYYLSFIIFRAVSKKHFWYWSIICYLLYSFFKLCEWILQNKIIYIFFFFSPKVSSDGNLPQPVASAPSRVAAVGPYIQSSTMPRIASRPELLVKPAFSDGTQALQVPDGPLKTQTLPNMRAGNSSQAKAPAGNSLQFIFFVQICFVFLPNSSVLTFFFMHCFWCTFLK